MILLFAVTFGGVVGFIVGMIFSLFIIILCLSSLPYFENEWRKINDEARLAEENETIFMDSLSHEERIYFFLGQSGAGKDTQVLKLMKKFEDDGIKYLYVSIGDNVRNTIGVIGTDNFFAKRMQAINDQSRLQPAVIPLYFFLTQFISKYTGEEVIIINGSPRSYKELQLWASLIHNGYLPPARIIHIDVTDEECNRRLKDDNRPGRNDTATEEGRATKLGWYAPIRKFLQEKLPMGVTLTTIDGMQSEEEVFNKVVEFFQKEDVLV